MNHVKGTSENERREARSSSGWSDVRTLDPAQARRVFSECKRVLVAKQRAAARQSTEPEAYTAVAR